MYKIFCAGSGTARKGRKLLTYYTLCKLAQKSLILLCITLLNINLMAQKSQKPTQGVGYTAAREYLTRVEVAQSAKQTYQVTGLVVMIASFII